jgi:hypothetical protein
LTEGEVGELERFVPETVRIVEVEGEMSESEDPDSVRDGNGNIVVRTAAAVASPNGPGELKGRQF